MYGVSGKCEIMSIRHRGKKLEQKCCAKKVTNVNPNVAWFCAVPYIYIYIYI